MSPVFDCSWYIKQCLFAFYLERPQTDLIAICRVSPGGVLWVPMTSPSSMLVPDHCVCKGQHSTFEDSWTRSYLPGAWEKFAGNVTISIINLSHMCAFSAILRLKIIYNKSIEAIELSKIPRYIWARVALSEIIPRTDFKRVDVGHQSVDLTWDTGHVGYIYRWMVGPLWIHIYGLYIFASGGGWRLPVKPYFFSFFSPQSTLFKDVCILLLMKPAFYFWTYFLFKHLFGFP